MITYANMQLIKQINIKKKFNLKVLNVYFDI